MHYDANAQPLPKSWLELDEVERIDRVHDYHRRMKVKLDSPELHAIAHVVVENQVALGDTTPVPATLNRLMNEGLDRHDAIHAIASILMNVVFDGLRQTNSSVDINARYSQELANLTATGWRSQSN